MKKIFAFILTAVLFTQSIVYAEAFDDVSNDAWYSESVSFVSENGIMTGKDNKFNPMQTTTRAEYVNALYNSSADKGTSYTSDFTDVSISNEYFSSIGWAQQKNITSGIGNGLFAPESSLTREMAMTFLYRALTTLDIIPDTPRENLLTRFKDYTNVSDWAFEGMNTLVNMGIINGTDDGRLNPQGTLNNAEVATMIHNMYSLRVTDETEKWKLNIVNINLQDKTISNDGALFDNNTIIITTGGDYIVTGTLNDGMIHINTAERVKIRLNNTHITTNNGACIFVEAADKAFITIEDGTQNSLTALNSEDGAIYSKDDLEIKGKGMLDITSKTGHGIKASDDLNIENGIINIEAYKDGIHINDTCELIDGNITITANGDGIDSENSIEITGGKYDITTTGDILETSSKGLSAIGVINILDGKITLTTTDKAIKSDNNILISGGKIGISSSHKGITATGNVDIDGGDIQILTATEGIESKQVLTIDGGDIFINVTDDGLNTGADEIYTEEEIKIPASKRDNTLIINGGNIEIYAKDDCLDSNAAVLITGGTIKTARHRGEVIDAGAAPITIKKGATMIYASQIEYAVENPYNEQNTIVLMCKMQRSDTLVALYKQDGKEIISFSPTCKFEAVTITTPEIIIGETYIVKVGEREYKAKITSNFTKVTDNYVSQAQSSSSFEKGFHKIDGSLRINYWLFTPKNATSNMPMIVYLHGGSGKGNNLDILTENGFCKWVSEGYFDNTPAYILFPQLSSEYKGWENIKSEIKRFIDVTANKYQVDKTNISLTGHSMGGTGVFALASAYPNSFSKIAPMSGSVRNIEQAAIALKNVPVWAFVGSDDNVVSPDISVNLISKLKQTSSNAKITVFENAQHADVPKLAYLDKNINIVNWLIGE